MKPLTSTKQKEPSLKLGEIAELIATYLCYNIRRSKGSAVYFIAKDILDFLHMRFTPKVSTVLKDILQELVRNGAIAIYSIKRKRNGAVKRTMYVITKLSPFWEIAKKCQNDEECVKDLKHAILECISY